ncbi:uncharacterized protein B0P05DRAFT_564697 [Gilbertella persicaria]|uniref:uncharacterized protein n=1 Tax=Gilbertella persicaria TaxID=101096 RepID=UPI0022206904|nr:uncharacterized protein B0P05DRAFT_564697 [Gilbertella persicaria]KAI8048150.1 hypothetical protein B0P05DRAFT_564697 [Gilbertella persicaria]
MKSLNAVRYLTLSCSLVGLASHFAQCTLFSVYQSQTGVPSWFTAGHWQYLASYVAYGLSIASAFMICIHATCCKRGHIVRGDKLLGIANTIVLAGAVVINTFTDTQEPWTHGIVEFKVPAKGFITFCSLLDQEHDATYPLLFQRCLLFNCTYIFLVAVCALWILLVLISCSVRPKEKPLMEQLPQAPMYHLCATKKKPILFNHSDFQYFDHSMPLYSTPKTPRVGIARDQCNSNKLSRHHLSNGLNSPSATSSYIVDYKS